MDLLGLPPRGPDKPIQLREPQSDLVAEVRTRTKQPYAWNYNYLWQARAHNNPQALTLVLVPSAHHHL